MLGCRFSDPVSFSVKIRGKCWQRLLLWPVFQTFGENSAGVVGIRHRFLVAADAAAARSPRLSAWGIDRRPSQGREHGPSGSGVIILRHVVAPWRSPAVSRRLIRCLIMYPTLKHGATRWARSASEPGDRNSTIAPPTKTALRMFETPAVQSFLRNRRADRVSLVKIPLRPAAKGDQASICTTLSFRSSYIILSWKKGCVSIWLMAGLTLA